MPRKSPRPAGKRAAPSSAPFARLADRYLRWRWRSSPLTATYEGIHEYDDRLDRMDAEAVVASIRERKGFLREIEGIEAPPRSADERIDREVLAGTLRGQICDLEEIRAWERDPSTYPQAALAGVFLLTVREFAPLEERLGAIRARMEEIPRLLEEGKGNLKECPPVFSKIALEVARAGVGFFARAVPDLARPYGGLEEKVRRAGAKAAEAMGAYADHLERVVVPASRGSAAIGERLFNEKLKNDHALDRTAGDLWDFGRASVAAAEGELARAAREIDPARPWRELVAELKRDHPSEGGLLAAYRTQMERARDFVRDRGLATLPPRERLEVIETPPFDRPTTPYAALMPPAPFEGDQKSLFYVTPVDPTMPPEEQEERLKGHATQGIPVTASHEAYPGHHLQLSAANAHPSRLRRTFGTPLLIEGWGLYSEEVMFEQGFFPDRRVRLFQLKDVLWRAARIVVDVGLHTRGMTEEEAVDFLVERAGLERPNARAEVNRYCANPTYQLCYYLGKAEILKVRSAVREREGGRFSLAKFHDRFLAFGSISPVLIGRELLSNPSA